MAMRRYIDGEKSVFKVAGFICIVETTNTCMMVFTLYTYIIYAEYLI